MNNFLKLKLTYGGDVVEVRADAIVAVETYEGYQTIRLAGNATAYNVLPGQFSLDRMNVHTARAGVTKL